MRDDAHKSCKITIIWRKRVWHGFAPNQIVNFDLASKTALIFSQSEVRSRAVYSAHFLWSKITLFFVFFQPSKVFYDNFDVILAFQNIVLRRMRPKNFRKIENRTCNAFQARPTPYQLSYDDKSLAGQKTWDVDRHLFGPFSVPFSRRDIF